MSKALGYRLKPIVEITPGFRNRLRGLLYRLSCFLRFITILLDDISNLLVLLAQIVQSGGSNILLTSLKVAAANGRLLPLTAATAWAPTTATLARSDLHRISVKCLFKALCGDRMTLTGLDSSPAVGSCLPRRLSELNVFSLIHLPD